MPPARQPFPPPTDPLGETLHLLQLTGTLYCRAELTAPWGVEVPSLGGCNNVDQGLLDGLMTFQVVTEGACWLEVEGEAPRLLRQGSLTVLPHGTAHRLRSALDAELEPLFAIPVEKISERYEVMRYGGGGARTQMTYGVVRFDHAAAHRLVALLPRVLEMPEAEGETRRWLESTLHFVVLEAGGLRPGGETVITRLADVLVILAIRAWIESAPQAQHGWLGALRDAQIGRALALIHREPGRAWSLPSLATAAGMSRSAFSSRFADLVGEPVMRYVTRWRMQLARMHLRTGTEPLAQIAARLGYQSEAAFSRAFTRTFGAAPGGLRRAASLSPPQPRATLLG